jgi:hypothetical protein
MVQDAPYTFRWSFTVNAITYTIYGSSKADKDSVLPVGTACHRINLLEAGLGDYVSNNFAEFAKDKGNYDAQAQHAKNSGSIVFVINCEMGRLRSAIMAMRLYMLFANVDAATAMSVFLDKKTLNNDKLVKHVSPTEEMKACIKAALTGDTSVGPRRRSASNPTAPAAAGSGDSNKRPKPEKKGING